MKTGDKIKYRCCFIHYRCLGDKHPTQGMNIKEGTIIKRAKGTDFTGSDWVVRKSSGEIVGIGTEQIIEVIK